MKEWSPDNALPGPQTDPKPSLSGTFGPSVRVLGRLRQQVHLNAGAPYAVSRLNVHVACKARALRPAPDGAGFKWKPLRSRNSAAGARVSHRIRHTRWPASYALHVPLDTYGSRAVRQAPDTRESGAAAGLCGKPPAILAADPFQEPPESPAAIPRARVIGLASRLLPGQPSLRCAARSAHAGPKPGARRAACQRRRQPCRRGETGRSRSGSVRMPSS